VTKIIAFEVSSYINCQPMYSRLLVNETHATWNCKSYLRYGTFRQSFAI